jgi:hypothetical protein
MQLSYGVTNEEVLFLFDVLFTSDPVLFRDYFEFCINEKIPIALSHSNRLVIQATVSLNNKNPQVSF